MIHVIGEMRVGTLVENLACSTLAGSGNRVDILLGSGQIDVKEREDRRS
jgi:hypothetical protein